MWPWSRTLLAFKKLDKTYLTRARPTYILPGHAILFNNVRAWKSNFESNQICFNSNLGKAFRLAEYVFLTKDPWTRRFTHGELILCEERGTLKLLYDLFCLWKEEKSGKKLGVWKLTDDLSCFLCKIFISISFWKFRSKILTSIPASIYFVRYCSQRENCLF